MSKNDIKIDQKLPCLHLVVPGRPGRLLAGAQAPGRLRGGLPKVACWQTRVFTGIQPGPTGLQPGLQPGFPGEFLALKPTTDGSKQKETLTRSTPGGVGGSIYYYY